MSESEEGNVDWEEQSEDDPEEQPLLIAGKSFTELLEDRLRHEVPGQEEEEERKGNDINSQSASSIKPPRPFLRRGMGLTRSGKKHFLIYSSHNASFTTFNTNFRNQKFSFQIPSRNFIISKCLISSYCYCDSGSTCQPTPSSSPAE